MKEHYIYKTTNIINKKFYFGKHSGELDDSYLGSGKTIKKATSELNIAQGSISRCCSGRRKTAGGFIWRHKK